jgi:transketolase
MMSAVHGYMFFQAEQKKQNWFDLFHFVNDAGHCENGLYALKANYGLAHLTIDKLKAFRSIESGLTGHGEAHLFPEAVYISNGPLGSGLPQAQGLAVAESLSKNPRTTITAISDGACMEGEAKEAFAAIPGLAIKNQLGPFVCMISDNNTKLSGRIDSDSFSMKPSFESLKLLGWEVTYVEDGHDLSQVYHSIEEACEKAQNNPQKPQLLWMKTIKGKGVSQTEKSASGGHGFPLKKADQVLEFISEIHGKDSVPEPMKKWATELTQLSQPDFKFEKVSGARTKIQTGVSEALCLMSEKNYPVVSISADLQGSTGVEEFRKKYPQSSFEVGVAESNMVSMAIGLSKQGYIPFVDTFAQFGITKGALPLIMSGLSEAPIMAIYSHTGFQDAADGASHQAITYFSMLSGIPNVDVICLTCADEAKELISQAVEKFVLDRKQNKIPRSTIFFLGRETYPASFSQKADYKLGKAQIVSEKLSGNKKAVAIFAVGSLLENALIAQEKLGEKGIDSIVVNPSAINHPDLTTTKSVLDKVSGNLIIIEDHRSIGGFASMLTHALCEEGISFKLKSLGIKDHFGRSAYTSDQLYEMYGLGVTDIVQAAHSL